MEGYQCQKSTFTIISPVVEDNLGTQLRKKWYKSSFLLLGTKFNGEQHIQNPKISLMGKLFYSPLKFCYH